VVPAFLGGINLPLEAQGHRLAGVSSLLHGASSNSTFSFPFELSLARGVAAYHYISQLQVFYDILLHAIIFTVDGFPFLQFSFSLVITCR